MVDGLKYSCLPRALGFAPMDQVLRGCCGILGDHPYAIGPQLQYEDLPGLFVAPGSVDLDRPSKLDRAFEISALGCDRLFEETLLLAWMRFGDTVLSLSSALLEVTDRQLRLEFERSGTLLNQPFVRSLYEKVVGEWPVYE